MVRFWVQPFHKQICDAMCELTWDKTVPGDPSQNVSLVYYPNTVLLIILLRTPPIQHILYTPSSSYYLYDDVKCWIDLS